jgi:hypothetical protein
MAHFGGPFLFQPASTQNTVIFRMAISDFYAKKSVQRRVLSHWLPNGDQAFVSQ